MTNIKVITPLGLENSEFYRLYLKNKNDKGIWISVDISNFTSISTTKGKQEYQCKSINIDEKGNKMTTFEDAKVWDRVFDIRHGWGVVEYINKYEGLYPIQVRFKANTCAYAYDGKAYIEHISQSLFWDEVIITPPEKPLPKLEVDTKVLVWDTSHTEKTKAYFSHFDKHGKAVTFRYGKTSWSRNTDETLFTWQHWELPKD